MLRLHYKKEREKIKFNKKSGGKEDHGASLCPVYDFSGRNSREEKKKWRILLSGSRRSERERRPGQWTLTKERNL